MPNPMKICLVSPGFPPEDGGGIGTYLYHLAQGLIARGHEVFVITQSDHPDKKEEIEKVHIFRYKFRYLPKLEKFLCGLRYSHFIGQKIKELDKKYHLDKSKKPELLERNRPGINKNRFHVKNHKDESVNIILNAKLNPGISLGLKAAFIGSVFGGGGFFGSNEARHDNREYGEDNGKKDKKKPDL